MNPKKIIASLVGIALSIASTGIVYAQTSSTTTSTPSNPPTDILGTVRSNLMNVNSVHVSGIVNGSIRSNEENPLIRFVLPDSWQNTSTPISFNFDGNVSRSTTTGQSSTSSLAGIQSSWNIININSSTTGAQVGSMTIVTNGTNVSFTASMLYQWLRSHGLLSPTSTNSGTNSSSTVSSSSSDWLSVDVPKFAGEVGLTSWLKEKSSKVMNAINDPEKIFTATRMADETVNGMDSYHYQISAKQNLLNSMFGTSTEATSTFTRIGRGDLWITKSTLLPNRLTFTTSARHRAANSSSNQFSLTANFDQYNGAATSTAPSLVRTIEDLLREVFQHLMNYFSQFAATNNPGPTPTTTPPVTPTSTPVSTSTPPTSTPPSAPSSTTSTR